MAALAVILGLVVLSIPVAVIVLLVAQSRMRREIATLRSRTETLERALAGGTPLCVTTSEDKQQTAAASDVTSGSRPAPPPQTQPAAIAASATAPDREATSTPWRAPDGAENARPPETAPPKGPSLPAQFAAWLRDNWFYAVAAVSLALAGLFLVQYGVETGLLTPPARVAAALIFGAALIAGGEQIRRRSGDGAGASTAYLPSTLSSAGLVSLMGGVLAARLLYDLIPPGPALAGLFAIALFALWLGWRHGPLLAAIGLTGGMAAPFLVGGTSDTPEWLLVYFGLLTALGLGIDTLRRWAWVSVLSLVLGFASGAMLLAGLPSQSLLAAAGLYACTLVLMAVMIPARSVFPDHAAPALAEAFRASEKRRPAFPVVLAAGTTLAGCLALLTIASAPMADASLWWLMLTLATALAVLLILWSGHAPGLQDLATLPTLAILALIAAPELNRDVLDAIAVLLAAQETQTEVRLPWHVTLALLPGLAVSAASAWRSVQCAPYAAIWAGAAALAAPVAGLLIELTWQPANIVGAWPWALHAIVLSALMTALAARFASRDEDHLRAALATLSALSCMAFALTLILTDAALTLALGATVVVAAGLDRRFDLAPMTVFITAGVVALGYRLLADPGLDWASRAPFPEMLAAYGGTLLALLVARHLIAPRDRQRARVILESGAWSAAGVTLSMVLYHGIEGLTGHASNSAHWVLGLHATVWIGAALAQVQRLSLGGVLKPLRIALGGLFALFALGLVTLILSLSNPLFDNQAVLGVVVLNTLLPAYLLPGLLLGLGALRLATAPRILRIALAVAGLVLTTVWVGLAIRHAWQGGEAMAASQGITQPELYSYTVALLAVGAGLFYQALARRADRLRLVGVGVIAVAVAKVFLIDISGLDGLARVFSFLLLGLSLAGLAWVNRWVQMRAQVEAGD